MKGMVSLISVTSGAIFIFAFYVLVRSLKINHRSFVLIIVIMIMIGTVSGTLAVGYEYAFYNEVSQFNHTTKLEVE